MLSISHLSLTNLLSAMLKLTKLSDALASDTTYIIIRNENNKTLNSC